VLTFCLAAQPSRVGYVGTGVCVRKAWNTWHHSGWMQPPSLAVTSRRLLLLMLPEWALFGFEGYAQTSTGTVHRVGFQDAALPVLIAWRDGRHPDTALSNLARACMLDFMHVCQLSVPLSALSYIVAPIEPVPLQQATHYI
jgi:hypothetical protein